MEPILAVSLVGGALAIDNRAGVRLMLSQPVCGGLITGILLGSPADGFFAGALLQMLFLGWVSLRSRAMPDLTLGGVAAAAFYATGRRALAGDPSLDGLMLALSLALALAVALAGLALYRVWESRSWVLAERALALASVGRTGRAAAIHFSTIAVHFAAGFVVTGASLLAGLPVVRAVAGRPAPPWAARLEDLPLLVLFIGAGSVLGMNLGRVRLFWFLAGALAVLVGALFR